MKLNAHPVTGNVRILYHKVDYDGKGSAALLKRAYPDATLHKYDYNIPVNEAEFLPNDTLFIVDFSFKPEILFDLQTRYSVIWIDHHKSALEAYDNFVRMHHRMDELDLHIPGIRDRSRAAVAIVFDYLTLPPRLAEHPPTNTLRPRVIELMDKFDRWQHKGDPEVMFFNTGLQTYPDDPDLPIWDHLFATFLNPEALDATSPMPYEEVIQRGAVIEKYLEQDHKAYVSSTTFEHTFTHPLSGKQTRFLCCNRGRSLSSVLNSKFKRDQHDAVAFFSWRPEDQAWRFSTYGNDNPPDHLDLSEIATYFGGGGHRDAAGFYVKDLYDFFGDNAYTPMSSRPKKLSFWERVQAVFRP